MAKKQDSFYYENFSECAACACQAAHYLEDALKNFKPEGLSSMLDELHQVEHAADEKKHELSNVLARASSPPSSGRTSSCSARASTRLPTRLRT